MATLRIFSMDHLALVNEWNKNKKQILAQALFSTDNNVQFDALLVIGSQASYEDEEVLLALQRLLDNPHTLTSIRQIAQDILDVFALETDEKATA